MMLEAYERTIENTASQLFTLSQPQASNTKSNPKVLQKGWTILFFIL